MWHSVGERFFASGTRESTGEIQIGIALSSFELRRGKALALMNRPIGCNGWAIPASS
jgi:hypothetical protein